MLSTILNSLSRWSQEFAASTWAHGLLLLLTSTLVTWFGALLLARRLNVANPAERSREEMILRHLVQTSLWPLFALGLSAAALELGWPFGPEFYGESRRVLAILVFFLIYRWIDLLVGEFARSGVHRRHIRRGLLPTFFVLLTLHQLDLLSVITNWLGRPMVLFGQERLSALAVIGALLVLLGSSFVARVVFVLIGQRFLPGFGVERALSEAIATIVRYLLVAIGFLWCMDLLGFDLTTIKIGLGALGVGIGFGLQTIVNNFTSGLILLFERSVKHGDILTIDGTDGRVEQVGLRASVLRTRKGDDLIMPNSILVENLVTNYSYRDNLQRVDIDVGVSYEADPNAVRDLLLATAKTCRSVLSYPPPAVLFRDFGTSSIDFQLRVWTNDPWKQPLVRSELLFAIWYALKKAGIEIPYPQQDLHLRSGFPESTGSRE